ncbi:MAG TPA: SRPBCC family protein [Anaeromyxobacteraceae bacterium]
MASSATREIVIGATPERVFDIIADYGRYPEFVPAVKACRARRQGSVVEVDFEVDLGVKRIRYKLRHVEERPTRVSWSLVAGEWMKVSNGSWELRPEGSGGTRALYTVEIQIAKPPLVPQALVDRVTDELTRVQLPRTLEAFKLRAEQAQRS